MAIAPTELFSNTKQEFLNSVINKIGRQEYSNQAYVNPLKRLKGGFIENAQEIEEIYVAPVEDTGYDKEGTGVLDRVKPSVFVQYHNNEIEHGYKASIHVKEFRKGFTTQGGVTKLANHIIQSIHTGSELDEYQDVIDTMKALKDSALETQVIKVAPVTDESTAKTFCKTLKKIMPKMAEWNSLYSAKPNYAKAENLMLAIDSDVDVEVEVEWLAKVFNMSVADFNATTKIKIPNFKAKMGDTTIAMLFDTRCIKVHPTFYDLDSIKNTKGKFINYDLVTSLLLSYTNWFQFVVIQEETA